MNQHACEPALFRPYPLRDIVFGNRIFVSPMGQHSADDGFVNDWHLAHLGQLSVSGAAAVITEAVAIEPAARISPGCLGLWRDEQIEGYRRIVAFRDAHGSSRLGIQLGHSGRKGSVTKSWLGQKSMSDEEGGWPIYNASAIAYPGRRVPIAIDRAKMEEVIRLFVAATRRAHDAGFDFIEIHGAHGYLLHSFLTPLLNRRDDAYGGSLENRMRYPLEVFDAIRAAWPQGKPIGMRLSVTDWIDGGWTPEESVVFAKELRERGCDYICASTGGVSPEQDIPVGPLYQAGFAERIQRDAGIPAMAVGLITEPKDANDLVASGKVDMVAIGRAMLYNPRWAWHAAEALGASADYPLQYDRAHPSMRRNNAFIVQRERT